MKIIKCLSLILGAVFTAFAVNSTAFAASSDNKETQAITVSDQQISEPEAKLPGTVINSLPSSQQSQTQVMLLDSGDQSVGYLILDKSTIDRIPVQRSLFGVSMLAPFSVAADKAFGDIVSFGGSSVAENICFINDLNVTNFRNGLGCSSAPFEFYEEFRLQTGGISAKYGLVTGGMIQATTKSGGNEFHWGVSLYAVPWIDSISGHDPNVYTPGTSNLVRDNQFDERSSSEINLWFSGAIIKDKLFYYVLLNQDNVTSKNYDAVDNDFIKSNANNLFWGAKLDWYLARDHKLELTAFSDFGNRDATVYAYNTVYLFNGTGANARGRGQVGEALGTLTTEDGGENYILKYTGYLTDAFMLSASYGRNEYSLAEYPPEEPLVLDCRTGICAIVNNPLGGGPYGNPDRDIREQFRIDGEWFLGEHLLKFGLYRQERTSIVNLKYSGSEPYTHPLGMTFNGGQYYTVDDYFPSNAGYEVRVQHYSASGTFQTDIQAVYLEDQWNVTDDLILNIGMRYTSFANKNPLGQVFIEMDNQMAPRLSSVWDVSGDGDLIVFGSYGRYFLPVANNTNVRFSGGETLFVDYYAWDGTFDAANYNIPGFSSYFGGLVFENGTVPDVSGMVDAGIEPAYQDEITLGIKKRISDNLWVNIKAIHRNLKNVIQDGNVGFGSGKGVRYAIINPGQPVTLCDVNGCISYSVEEAGLPAAVRKYNAVAFSIKKAWDGEWFLQGSYTWAHSYGNTEGYVKSDTGQSDAGLTTDFDYPGLMDYSYGDLPNDRRHTIKIFGAWRFAETWEMGANFLASTGRPINAFGVHPDQLPAASVGAVSFYYNGEPSPRGSRGRTETFLNLNLSLKHFIEVGDGRLTLGVGVFNVLNSHAVTEVQEQAEFEVGPGLLGPGAQNPNYGIAAAFQTPRYLRVSAEFEF